jgi:hypothetical protein
MDRTGEQGRFLLRWSAGRRPLIAARAEGFVAGLRELREEEIGGEVELVLKPSALIEGVVFDEKGQPAASGAVFSVAGDDVEEAEAVKPWRVYYHRELNAPYRFVLKDIERDSARYLIVDHRGKYHREVVPLDDELRSGKRQVEVRLRPDASKTVPVELAVKPFDRVTGSTPIDPYPQVSVLRLPSEEAIHVHGNNSYGGFAWWCEVEPGEYRVEVATPGFLLARETIVVPADPEGRSQSGCCDKQFWLNVPIDRDPAQRGRFDLPEILRVELLDGRDRKPPPEEREVVWQAFRDPGGEPAFDEIRARLRHEDGAARLQKELGAGKYAVRVRCEGFGERTVAVTLPQASPVVEVLLPPEWQDVEDARAAIPHLVLQVRHDQDERPRAARALVRIGAAAAEPLMELLSDADLDVRLAAILASGDLRPVHPGTLERIVPLLADAEPQIRSSAARALGKLGDEAGSAVPDLIRLLDDPVDHVRSAAASALGMLGPLARDARASLELLLDDEYEWARLNAKRALDRIAGRAGLER